MTSSLARVDTVGFSFPITGDVDLEGCTASVSGLGTSSEAWRYRRKLPSGGFLGTGVGNMAWVEASLPKVVGGDNVEGLHPDQVLDVCAHLHSEARRWVCPRTELRQDGRTVRDGANIEHASLRRLDVVRDFDGVTAIPELLDGLATITRPGRAKIRRFADAERGRAETLRVGPRSSWAATLYDKHAESPEHAAPGRLRFECRLRSKFLASVAAVNAGGSMSDLGEITPERCDALLTERFHTVGFDRQVNGAGSFAARVNESDLSPRVKRDLVGYLAARALGIDLEMSANTERKYRRLAEQLGFVLSDVTDGAFSASLDLQSGRERLEPKHPDGDSERRTGIL